MSRYAVPGEIEGLFLTTRAQPMPVYGGLLAGLAGAEIALKPTTAEQLAKELGIVADTVRAAWQAVEAGQLDGATAAANTLERDGAGITIGRGGLPQSVSRLQSLEAQDESRKSAGAVRAAVAEVQTRGKTATASQAAIAVLKTREAFIRGAASAALKGASGQGLAAEAIAAAQKADAATGATSLLQRAVKEEEARVRADCSLLKAESFALLSSDGRAAWCERCPQECAELKKKLDGGFGWIKTAAKVGGVVVGGIVVWKIGKSIAQAVRWLG